MAKVTQTINRPDGSQVRIVAEEFFGVGLHRSVDVRVHRRETPAHPWSLANDRPHPDWRSMSVEEYKQRGRSEMLQVASPGEILRAVGELDKIDRDDDSSAPRPG